MIHSHVVPALVYAFVEFEGRINRDRLVTAVEKVSVIIPETLYGIDVDRCDFRPVGIVAADIVEEASSVPDHGLELDPRDGPQVKILIGHGLQGDTLIVTISHVLSDAAGLWQFIGLLSDFYNGKNPSVRNSRALTWELVKQKVGGPTPAEAAGYNMTWGGIPLGGSSAGPKVRVRSCIPADSMSALHARTKRCGVTLNDVFVTAYARVAARLQGVDTVHISCPVDLRRLADLGELTVANMTGRLQITVTFSAEDSFSTTLDQVHAEVAELRSRNRAIMGLRRLPEMWTWMPIRVVKFLIGQSYRLNSISYSNVGVLDESRVQFDQCSPKAAHISGAYVDTGGIFMMISTFKGATTFVAAFLADEQRAHDAQDIITMVTAECESWLLEPAEIPCPGCGAPRTTAHRDVRKTGAHR
ncbi:MAG: hypothetical protein FWF25_06410 [Propionibacteriaceae bacterium]|nr:hypothetical protein [Propionibacteriaceae bacterium]